MTQIERIRYSILHGAVGFCIIVGAVTFFVFSDHMREWMASIMPLPAIYALLVVIYALAGLVFIASGMTSKWDRMRMLVFSLLFFAMAVAMGYVLISGEKLQRQYLSHPYPVIEPG